MVTTPSTLDSVLPTMDSPVKKGGYFNACAFVSQRLIGADGTPSLFSWVIGVVNGRICSKMDYHQYDQKAVHRSLLGSQVESSP